MVFSLFFSPLLPVLYSAFSRIQKDLPKLREALLFVAKGTAIVAAPIGFGLHAFRVPLAEVVFGERWDGVATVIGILALTHGISWLVGANGEVYRAIGKPQVETIAIGAPLLLFLVGYLMSVRHGLEIFLIVRLALEVPAVFFQIWLVRNQLGIAATSWIRICAIPISFSALLWAAAEWSQLLVSSQITWLIFYLLLAIVGYFAVLIVFERAFLLKVLGIVRGKNF